MLDGERHRIDQKETWSTCIRSIKRFLPVDSREYGKFAVSHLAENAETHLQHFKESTRPQILDSLKLHVCKLRCSLLTLTFVYPIFVLIAVM
jgi:hypothetical protein